ncbi:MAG: hypothetical protein LQ342_004993 [Letrouitia transgressa]|nr:MAG: hypothetical protein LQ342_004993 [Letrouitia transgressa]
MAPSLRDHAPSVIRPSTRDTRDRPSTRDHVEHSLVIPSRTSSLHSRITQPISSALNVKPNQRTPKTLTHAYMVCGVGREPSQWVKAPPPAQGKIGHMKGAVGQFWLPEILGSSPRLEQDNEIARALYAAMRQDSSHTLYGIALRVWSRADEKRAETIRDLRRRTESDFFESSDETYWIPYCLSFLSRYPLYDLLGDYLRGMWIHWNKATNLFHAEEVSRILSFPAPRLNDLVRIDMRDYALCYQFPSSPTGFQNFAMWPLFTCLSISNIVGVIEAAVSATRRIIFVSHYPAMLTVASETIRTCVRVYEWSGLYVPVVHARHARELVQEPGPYMLGITAECRTLFTAPSDALVIDLDRNFVLTSSPPTVLSPGQRAKMITRLTNALNGDVAPSGPPSHLRSAYGGGKLIPAGQIIVMRGQVESVENPAWWNQDNVMGVMDRMCEKLGRNTGVKAVFGGSVKKPLMTKVSMRHLNEIVRERNQYSRDAMEAWQDFINLKGRMDTELSKVTKRNNFLVEELEGWKQQFLKFQAFAEQLTKETQDLKVKIETYKRENRRLTVLIDQQKDDAARLTVRLSGTEKQRDDALEALVLQQDIAEELERERKRNQKDLSALQHTNATLLRQRDESQRVVLHLQGLINGQTHHMEHIVRSLNKTPEPDYVGEGYHEDTADGARDETGAPSKLMVDLGEEPKRAYSRASTTDENGDIVEGENVTPEMESRLFSSLGDKNGLTSSPRLSIVDVADRHLRDKTDAIANIIRNISEQCAAAVEGLQLAHDAEQEDDDLAESTKSHDGDNQHLAPSHEGDQSIAASTGTNSEAGADNDADDEDVDDGNNLLSPDGRHSRNSSVPPTPDLVPPNRSSTSMSMTSASTGTHDRNSGQYASAQQQQGDVKTKIVEDPEDEEEGRSESGRMGTVVEGKGVLAKHSSAEFIRPATARVVG